MKERRNGISHIKNVEGFTNALAGAAELGLTQRDLALRFRVPERWISAWTNGTLTPHPGIQQYVIETLQKKQAEAIGK
jgi:predicted transcriptional regulator